MLCINNLRWGGVAVINCCEHEYSIASDYRPGANPLDPVRLSYAIKEAKTKADYVIVIVHGGIEGYQLPTPRMQEWYRFFIDCGADVVVNHHQHCYSGYEKYNGRYIFYGLGNFCFDRNLSKSSSWHEGFMLKFSFESELMWFEMIPYMQCKDKPMVEILRDKSGFNKEIERLNSIINDDFALESEYVYYMDKTKRSQKRVLCPYTNRYLTALYCRGILPNFFPASRCRILQNAISCESHRERFQYYLKNKLK